MGFWSQIRSDPFSRPEWREALRLAPTIKEDFYTILSEEGSLADAQQVLDHDPRLEGCFIG